MDTSAGSRCRCRSRCTPAHGSRRRWRIARPCRRARPVLPAAVPADQGAAGAQPRGGRVAAGRGDPQRDRARARASACQPGHGAQGDRRARRRPPAWCAGRARARSSPRTPRRRIAVPLPAHPARRRRRRTARPAALLDVRRGKATGRGRPPAGVEARRSRGRPAPAARIRRAAGGARRHHAAGGAVPRPDAGGSSATAGRCTGFSRRSSACAC